MCGDGSCNCGDNHEEKPATEVESVETPTTEEAPATE